MFITNILILLNISIQTFLNFTVVENLKTSVFTWKSIEITIPKQSNLPFMSNKNPFLGAKQP
jgi:hypothetical protein